VRVKREVLAEERRNRGGNGGISWYRQMGECLLTDHEDTIALVIDYVLLNPFGFLASSGAHLTHSSTRKLFVHVETV
jgi:hypothetical protein